MIAAFLLLAVQASPDAAVSRRVERLLERSPVIDGHNDLAWEIRDLHDAKVEAVDLSVDTARLPNPLQTDIPRLRKGHVGGQFWSVYIPADAPRAVEMTLEEIDIVRRFVAANPTTFELATTAADIRRIEKAGRIASLIGVEGGHQIDGRLSVLRQYRALGVAYMTLTHGKSLNWADSSTDAPRANGLSDFGRQVVAEMNRIGMIVDVSHVSDATMAAALAATKAPVIASHSSARDRRRAAQHSRRSIAGDRRERRRGHGELLPVVPVGRMARLGRRALGLCEVGRRAGGGLWRQIASAAGGVGRRASRASGHRRDGRRSCRAYREDRGSRSCRDRRRLRRDQGTGPIAMKGVDGYPLLFAELARRGWSDGDLAKLSGGNVLRVMERVEAVAKGMVGMPPVDATDVASR
ncbi:dipeptidase [Sphingomonas sp. LR55]|uniref:dipeptidase n=1 Tax=Sphingomonas sp. LR55 TaxID=3050231 RepID=UPI003FA68914